MAAISLKTSVIIALLQIRALISVRTTAVTGMEGHTFYFRCEYPDSWQSNAKYFCHVDDNVCVNYLIQTDKHDQWETDGRFSLYDNTTGEFLLIKVDKLVPEDSGTYWCGVDISLRPDHISVIQLNVSRAKPPENLTHYITVKHDLPKDLDKLNMPLFLTAVMYVAAVLFVCLFTLALLMAVKHGRPVPRQNREASSDYETMMPGVGPEPGVRCSSSDLPAAPPPPPDLCSHFTSKNRESSVTLGLGEYVDVDVPGHICQYQHLDLSQLEEHVYYSLQGNSDSKNGPLGFKEQINC